ncbi:MAG: hypothetical protein CMJ89_00505 [Planctomycetes bacterium]|nr:hypothetical protein [Planctomycetota bacterium]
MNTEHEPTRLKIGEGYISGYLSVFLGLVSLGGVLCFLFPEFLTTPEFRSQYPVEVFRQVLRGCLLVSFALALLSIGRAGGIGALTAAMRLRRRSRKQVAR